MSQLLEGVKVVELAIYAFVPSAGAALADWGADVIKVEHPETGDPVRGLVSYGVKPGDGGVTPLWEVFNRGKKSVGIDIHMEAGLELLMCLIDEADVFLTNFMQPARARLGIDVDQVLARNPRIIYGRGTGHGPTGPDANKGGFDGISYWSRPGVATASTPPGYDYPIMLPGPAFGDVQSGMHLAGGVAAALYRREKTGQGGVVDVSLLGSGLWAMGATIAGSYAIGADNIVQLDRRRPENPLANLYRSGDGRFFVLGMLESDKYWSGLCQALGRPELEDDPRFSSFANRRDHSQELVEVLDEIFGALSMVQLAALLDAQAGQWARVEFPGDVVKDEQALLNDYIRFIEYDNGARLPITTVPVRLDGEEVSMSRAPTHGEHTDEVVTGLGRSMEELMELKIGGVIN
jgi:crotonobetainyl-CoA:carnitine CoA-transferase CaiB-like acyl-CoA transferase